MNKVNEGRLGNGGRERRDTREELNRGSRTNRNYDGRALAVDDTAVGFGLTVPKITSSNQSNSRCQSIVPAEK